MRLTVESTPAGATVTDVHTGRPLGQTPLTFQRPAAFEPITVRIEKVGFVAATRELKPDRDRSEAVTLAALAVEPAGGGAGDEPGRGQGKTTSPEGASGTARPKAPRARPHRPPRGEDEPAKL